MKTIGIRKHIGILLALLMLLALLPAGPAAAVGGIDETFDSLAAGEIPAGWGRNVADDKNAVGAVVEGDGMAMRVDATGATNSGVTLLSPSFDFEQFTVSYRVKFDNTTPYQGLYGESSSALGFHVTGGAFQFRKQDAPSVICMSAEAGKWYEVKLLVDNKTFMVELWINGEFITQGQHFRNNIAVTKLDFSINTGEAVGYLIDNVKVEEGAAFSTPSAELDFSGAQTDKADTFYPARADAVTFNNTSNLQHYDIVSGKFGKAADDRSLYAHNDAGATEASKADPFAAIDFTKTAAGSPIAAGDSAVLDLRVAFGPELSQIRFQGFAYSEDAGGDGKLGKELLVLQSDGRLRVFEKVHQLSTPMEPHVWYDIHLEVYAGDNSTDNKNTYSVWFNHQLVAQNQPFDFITRGTGNASAARNQFRGFHRIWINPRFNIYPQGDGYGASGFYVDDIRYTAAKGGLAPLEMGLSHADANVERNINFPYGVFVDGATTLQTLKAIQVTNGTLEAVRDASGNEITTDAIAGGYLDVMNYDCRHIYVPLRTSDYRKTVDGKDIVLAPDRNTSDTWVAYNNTDGSGSYKPYGPVAGKAEGDQSFVIIAGTGNNQGNTTDFLNYVLQAATGAKVPAVALPLTTEFSVYVTDFTRPFNAMLYFNGAEDGASAKAMVRIVNGQMTSGDKTAVCNIGWNRVAMTTYPGKDYVDVYLNGEAVSRVSVAPYQYVNMMRLATEQEEQGVMTALDDFVWYSGSYTPAARPSVAAASDDAVIDAGSRRITLYGDAIATASLESYLTMDCDAYYVYSDASLSQLADTVTADSVLVLRKGNEFVDYTLSTATVLGQALYYNSAQLLDGGNNEVPFDDMTAGTRTYQMNTILNNTAQPQNVVVLLALYDAQGCLQSVGTSEMVNIPGGGTHDGMLTARITVPQGMQGGKIRVFTWDSVTKLSPVTILENPNKASGQTQFTPSVDTSVSAGSDVSMAAQQTLAIPGDGTDGKALLSFDFHTFAGNAAESAVLRLHVSNNQYPAGDNYRYLKVYATEDGLTDATVAADAPSEKTYLGKMQITSSSQGRWIECNITDYINRCMDTKSVTLSLLFEGMFNVKEGFAVEISSAESANPPQLVLNGQQKPFDLEQMLSPDWEGDTIYNESVLPMLYEGETEAHAMLALDAEEILRVTDYSGKTVYEQGRDYYYKDGEIYIPATSTILFSNISANYQDTDGSAKTLTGKINDASVLYSDYPVSNFKNRDGKYIYFRENAFHKDQLLVTYRHAQDAQWGGDCLPDASQSAKLSNTIAKLKAGEPLRIAAFGSSTTADACASAEMNAAPCLPGWGSLVEHALSEYYHTDAIRYFNVAHGGKSSSTLGVPGVADLTDTNPDLVMIGFLTNETVSQEEYKANIQTIIDETREVNPDAEFILFSSKVSHDGYAGYDRIANYKDALAQIAEADEHIAYLDIQGVHSWLLERKNYESITGNNINHPNDYIHRIYAKLALDILCQ